MNERYRNYPFHSANQAGLGNRLGSMVTAMAMGALQEMPEITVTWKPSEHLRLPMSELLSSARVAEVDAAPAGSNVLWKTINPFTSRVRDILNTSFGVDSHSYPFRKLIKEAARSVEWSPRVRDDMPDLPEKFLAVMCRSQRKTTAPTSDYRFFGRSADGMLMQGLAAASRLGLPLFVVGDTPDLPGKAMAYGEKHGIEIISPENLRGETNMSARDGAPMIRAAAHLAACCEAEAVFAVGERTTYRDWTRLVGVPIIRQTLA